MNKLFDFLSFRSCMLLIFTVTLVSSAAAELEVYRGDSVTVQSANSTISWVRNYSFDINRTSIHNDTLVLGNRNISIYSDNSAPINSTLWNYNFSSPSYGDTLIQVQTSAVPSSAVHFRFTGLPTINKGEYRLNVDDELLKKFGSGGAVAWSYSDWSAHNFTVTYNQKPDDDPGDGDDSDDGSDSSSSGGGSYVRAGCEESGKRDSHSWVLVNRSEFVFNNIDPAIDIQHVEVNTQARRSEFAVCTGTIENLTATDFEAPANAYIVYQFEVDIESGHEIEAATIRFEVNQSFAEQYDRIVLSRYKGGWKNLDTTLVESNGEKGVYEAVASGFSYYAVRGENQAEDENQSNSSQNQTAGNQTSPVCGDDLCQQSESWRSCSTDCQKPEEAAKAEEAISDVEQQITEGNPGYRTLQQAKSRFEKGDYSEAERLAQKALKEHQNQSKQRSNQLPWILIAPALLD